MEPRDRESGGYSAIKRSLSPAGAGCQTAAMSTRTGDRQPSRYGVMPNSGQRSKAASTAARSALVASLRGELETGSFGSTEVPSLRPASHAEGVGAQARDVAGDLERLVGGCDQDALVSLAIAEGVAGPASERLAPLLQPNARSRLLSRAKSDATAHMARLAMLKPVGSALDGAGVDWVVLKGPALAELSYGRTARGYADIDVLVPAAQFKEAIDALQGAGMLLAEPSWPALAASGEKEVLLAHQGRPAVDLHWHVVDQDSARRRYLLPMEELLGRRRKVKLGPIEAWALEPTDFMLHVALHANASGSHRLRCLLDVQRTAANQPPHWDDLVGRCRAWRVALPVAAALERAKGVLGAQVPDDVTSRLLTGVPQRAVVSFLASWAPGGYLPAGRSFKNGLTRMLRDDLGGTAVAFVEEAVKTLGDVAFRRPSATSQLLAGGIPATADEQNLAGYEDYLQLVASADRYGRIARP